jgi:(2Fe-2S) ferredoxin
MPKFECHLFVCCNRREPGNARGCCNPDGADQLQAAFKAELTKHGLVPRVRANKSGCLDQCELGPTVVIYPQQIWYGGVRLEDVPRIVAETVIAGRVVSDLLIPDERLNTKPRPAAPPVAAQHRQQVVGATPSEPNPPKPQPATSSQSAPSAPAENPSSTVVETTDAPPR